VCSFENSSTQLNVIHNCSRLELVDFVYVSSAESIKYLHKIQFKNRISIQRTKEIIVTTSAFSLVLSIERRIFYLHKFINRKFPRHFTVLIKNFYLEKLEYSIIIKHWSAELVYCNRRLMYCMVRLFEECCC